MLSSSELNWGIESLSTQARLREVRRGRRPQPQSGKSLLCQKETLPDISRGLGFSLGLGDIVYRVWGLGFRVWGPLCR